MQIKTTKPCMPKLSIITVCLNDRERLIHTLNSLSKIYDDTRFEHIVIDGGSTDKSFEAINSFSGFENFKLYSALDSGIYDGMNRGLAHASGDWVLFLNCGDALYMGCDRLFSILSRFDQMAAPHILCFEYAAIFSGYAYTQVVNSSTKIKLPTSHQAMIFKRSWLIQNPYNSEMKIAADFDVFLKVDEEKVWLCSDGDVLTLVELDGLAFSRPTMSYYECLMSICRNKRGIDRIMRAVFLLAKYFVVILLKLFLPKSVYFKLRASLI